MKRLLTLILCLLLAATLAVPALAADEESSRVASCASMREYVDVFEELNSQNAFAALNRASLASALYRLADRFRDLSDEYYPPVVEADAWFARAAAWAADCGILELSDGQFLPAQAVSREEFALALQQFLTWSGASLTELNSRLYFYDDPYFSRLGREAAALMQRSGIMVEDENRFFNPLSEISNADAVTALLRFIGSMKRFMPDLPVSSVPESEPADFSWFDDVCFIGHSQVVGMRNYFDLYNAEYFAEVGFTAPDMLVHLAFKNNRGQYTSLKHQLEMGSFGKVYIMLGINDCSDRVDRIAEFKSAMRQILDLVRSTQPEARIYLISLVPVGREVAYPTIYNPENCTLYSQALKDLSREYLTEYIDLYRPLSDSQGYMLWEFSTGDGIHINPGQYSFIEDYIKCHT